MSGPLGVPALLLLVSACLWQAQGDLIISGIHDSRVNHNFDADFIPLFFHQSSYILPSPFFKP